MNRIAMGLALSVLCGCGGGSLEGVWWSGPLDAGTVNLELRFNTESGQGELHTYSPGQLLSGTVADPQITWVVKDGKLTVNFQGGAAGATCTADPSCTFLYQTDSLLKDACLCGVSGEKSISLSGTQLSFELFKGRKVTFQKLLDAPAKSHNKDACNSAYFTFDSTVGTGDAVSHWCSRATIEKSAGTGRTLYQVKATGDTFITGSRLGTPGGVIIISVFVPDEVGLHSGSNFVEGVDVAIAGGGQSTPYGSGKISFSKFDTTARLASGTFEFVNGSQPIGGSFTDVPFGISF